jgi:superfamily II DNA helicase RecQ
LRPPGVQGIPKTDRKGKKSRRPLARTGRVPACIVFSHAALMDMRRKRPAVEAAFLSVSGVGEVKLKKSVNSSDT